MQSFIHHHAARKKQPAIIKRHMVRLSILIRLFTAVVLLSPACTEADDISQKVESIVKDFKARIVNLESDKAYFIAVRSFMDANLKQPSKRSEQVTNSFFRNIRDRYLGQNKVVILNWQSIKPFVMATPLGTESSFDQHGMLEQKLKEHFGKGFIITGTTAAAEELVEINAKLIDMASGKILANLKETLPRGLDDVPLTEKKPSAEPSNDGAVVQSQKEPPAAAPAAPVIKETPSENQAAPEVSAKDAALKEKQNNLPFEIIEGKNFRYEGNVKNGKKHGQGTLYFKSGDKYLGQWYEDKKHGQGTYIYSDGEKYVGQWVNGNMHGQGTYFFKSGNKFTGNWQNNKKQGQGTYFFKNGDKWEGSYLNNKKHGRGVYTWASGESQEEVWEDGKLVK